uniref:FAD-dependent oxidoreductase n=1 Tax=Eiseniibacteriota bacterium TaxID=2212470 RepID=A0A832I687_UNCEI
MERTAVVIGAGVAGLACARELARRGVSAVVLERARGVGGRCATRRVEGQAVDHGVAFLHAVSREFGDALHELPAASRIPGWPLRVRGERMACQPSAYRPGRRRFAVHEGVSAFPKTLARDLDVRLGVDVVALREDGDRLVALGADGAAWRGRYLVVACAVDQSLRLIEPLAAGWPGAGAALERIRAVPVQPALTVIAGYPPEVADPPFDIWHPIEATMLHTVSHDSTKRINPRWRVLVLQGRPTFSRERLEAPEASWTAELLWEAGELLGRWAERPAWVQSHRWRSGRVLAADLLGDGVSLVAPGGAGLAVIGDAFASDPGLEGAYLSGVAMAEQIAEAALERGLAGPP